MTRLVDRFGRTGFAALSSLIWALPMAAWAGSSDLSPIDKTAYPWIALAIGLVMLVVWIVLLTRLGAVPVAARQRRLDFHQMSPAERRWGLGLAAFITGLIAWLNAAATVEMSTGEYRSMLREDSTMRVDDCPQTFAVEHSLTAGERALASAEVPCSIDTSPRKSRACDVARTCSTPSRVSKASSAGR